MSVTGVLAVAGIGWRQLWRDPVGLAFTFLAPVAVAAVMVGIYTSQDLSDGYSVGVVVDDGGVVGEDILRRLDANPVLEVHRYDDRRSLERAVRRRDVAAGVVVPLDVEETDHPVTIALIGPPEVAAPGGVRAAVDAAVAESAAALQLGRALAPDATAGTALAVGTYTMSSAGGRSATVRDDVAEWWGAAELAVVGTLVLFVAMNTMGASSLVAELNERGILARARTSATSPGAVALGLGLGLASYALVVGGLVLATGRLAFGIAWASWPGVTMVLLAFAGAAGGLGLLTGTLLPSPESGTTIAGPAGFTLGLAGGCLWPLELVGPALSWLGHATPHAWAVEALRTTGIDGGGLGDIIPQLAVLVGFAVATAVLGGRRLARLAVRTP